MFDCQSKDASDTEKVPVSDSWVSREQNKKAGYLMGISLDILEDMANHVLIYQFHHRVQLSHYKMSTVKYKSLIVQRTVTNY
jgi:hypothetical protein